LTGKYLDFSGPRELMPLGGDLYPDFLNYNSDINHNTKELVQQFFDQSLVKLTTAGDSDIEVSHN